MKRYVALLRGINVGGKNLIKMGALKACFEKHGLEQVSTYIQSGNVLFSSNEKSQAKLCARIEKLLSTTFDYESRVVVRSSAELRRTVEHAPAGFGDAPQLYRYDVLFLKEPLTAAEALDSIVTREGVDAVHAGRGVLYFSRLIRLASQSYLPRLVSQPVYQRMTIRNWNTTTKLLELTG